jgi:predicted ATP-grasp superfamily ATP-dependent carboligase
MAEILVAGLSARALSASARRAGYAPLAADLFADLDLRECADACIRIEGDLARGLEWEPLVAALTALAASRDPIGIVCAAGFEDRFDLLDGLADRWRLFGNSGAAVRRAKDPEILAATCARLGIPHPASTRECVSGRAWLRKREGGAGGSHVGAGPHAASDFYFQARVAGEPVAALALGSGERALALGLSAQWPDPLPDAPFRYGGAARPADVTPAIEAALEETACKIVEAFGLVGLNGVDFLVGPDTWHLIEVNPRPGATLDIFDSDDAELFQLHMAACQGELPAEKPVYSGAAASRILYARRTIAEVPDFDWPDWTTDRQPPGSKVRSGAPLCTIMARAATPGEARTLVTERGDQILAALGAD